MNDLPNRRTGQTEDFTWANQIISVTLNFHDDDKNPCEMFIKGMKEHSELGSYAHDIGVLISTCMQANVPLGVMAVTLGAEAPDPSMGALACKLVAEMETELKPQWEQRLKERADRERKTG